MLWQIYGEEWVSFHPRLIATGNYRSKSAHANESSSLKTKKFFEKETHEDFAYFGCSSKRGAKPGTTFVYHTSDTYLLGSAMDTFYKSKTSADSDFWRDEIVENMWKPLGLSPTSLSTKRSYDEVAQPFTGYDLTHNSDDVVKLAEFLNKAGGKIKGEQMLDSAMVKASLTLGRGGLRAGRKIDKYNNGIWYYDINGQKI